MGFLVAVTKFDFTDTRVRKPNVEGLTCDGERNVPRPVHMVCGMQRMQQLQNMAAYNLASQAAREEVTQRVLGRSQCSGVLPPSLTNNNSISIRFFDADEHPRYCSLSLS